MPRVAMKQHNAEDGERKPVFNGPCCRYIAARITLILIYFSLSIGLTFYQRWLLQRLKFPLFVTTGHLLVKFTLALVCRSILACWFKRPRVTLDWYTYCTKVAPVGLASGFDVGFSNWGLELVTISLYTMTKSTAVIFILFFAIIFKLERKSWRIVIIMLMISLGLVMFTYKSTQFKLFGFSLVMLATLSSGLRWTLAQVLMQKSKLGLSNAVDMLYHVQPWMLVMVLPFAISFEGVGVASSCKLFNYVNTHDIWRTTWLVLLGALLAFCMECAEYLLVSHTSSLTLSVTGIFKEVCTLILAVEWNGDQISGVNAVGLLMCLAGISLHVAFKAVQVSHSVTELTGQDDSDGQSSGGERNELRMPLLSEESSFTYHPAVLDDSDSEENSDILYSILQRRDNAAFDTDDR